MKEERQELHDEEKGLLLLSNQEDTPASEQEPERKEQSSNDDSRMCRICLEEDETETMIAPCQCKGSSKWVHRGCLDMWRINEKDRAFSQCTECSFQYYFESTQQDDADRRWRKAKFCLFVSRDICIVSLAVQVIIALLGWITMLLDKSGKLGLLDLFGGGCSGEASIIKCPKELAVYYTYGLMVSLVLLGFLGSTVLCTNGCRVPHIPSATAGSRTTLEEGTTTDPRVFADNRIHRATTADPRVPAENRTNRATTADPRVPAENRIDRASYYRRQRYRRHSYRRRDDDATVCCVHGCCYPYPGYYAPTYHDPVYYAGHNSDDCCSCGNDGCTDTFDGCGGDGNNDCAHILGLIFLLVVIVMAVIGFFVGVFLAVVIGQRVLQRHLFLLQKSRLVEEFRVKDLSSYDVSSLQTAEQQGHGLDSSLENLRPLPPPQPLHPEDESHLTKLGLM